MSFREQIVINLEQRGVEAQLAETRTLGVATYVGGMIDRTVEVDSTFIDFTSHFAQFGWGGSIHSVDVPEQLDGAVKIHFVESKIKHDTFADIIGAPNPYIPGVQMPVRKCQAPARIGSLYGTSPRSTFLHTSFGAHGLDMPTAKDLTLVIMNTLGADLFDRFPQVPFMGCQLEYEGRDPIWIG